MNLSTIRLRGYDIVLLRHKLRFIDFAFMQYPGLYIQRIVIRGLTLMFFGQLEVFCLDVGGLVRQSDLGDHEVVRLFAGRLGADDHLVSDELRLLALIYERQPLDSHRRPFEHVRYAAVVEIWSVLLPDL